MRISLKVQAGPYEGQRFEFEGHDNFVVGRSPRANLSLPDEGKHISRIHCMIEMNPPQCRLIDIGSTNGTLVNGQKIDKVDLKDGDLITVGKTVLLVNVTTHVETPASPMVPRAAARAADLRPAPETVHVAIAAPAGMHDTTIYDRPQAGPCDRGWAEFHCRVCDVPLPDFTPCGTGDSTARAIIPLCPACRQQIRSHPQPIPGYRLIREIGRGGMGVVYQALRARDAALIAVKTITPTVAGSREDVDRFLREVRTLRDLNHPNIIKLHEIAELSGLFHLSMEYVAGRDLAQLQKDHRGPLPIGRAVSLVCQLCSALDYAHTRDFVHRDVKPANLVVTVVEGREVVKLADFGLSRIYQSTSMSGLTLNGDLGGSPAFMAPEQFTELRNALPSVDQYSAGALLYTLLTERSPYDFPERLEQKIMKILLEDPVPIRERRPDLPDELTAVVDRALARKPQSRFATVKEMGRALAPFVR
jgi:serine/threonine-protein kinase